jgi:Protein of unknown function (DUF1585)
MRPFKIFRFAVDFLVAALLSGSPSRAVDGPKASSEASTATTDTLVYVGTYTGATSKASICSGCNRKAARFSRMSRWLRSHRENDFIDNLCRKMLAYALGRSLLLSDEPTIEEMRRELTANGYRSGTLVESIVASSQFLTKRSTDALAQQALLRPRPP